MAVLAVLSLSPLGAQSIKQKLTKGTISGSVEKEEHHEKQQAQKATGTQTVEVAGGTSADGYSVIRGEDGYYSVYNDNAHQWQIAEPKGSTLIHIVLYDARAVCVQRWLGHKWCIVDMKAYPNKRGYYQNAEVVSYEYDEVKCIARNAPIAVGKDKGKKTFWGLVTRNPETGEWSHSVGDVWSSMDLYRHEDIYYARALSEGYAALYALDGSIIAEGPYEDLNIFDGMIEYKKNGEWHQLRKIFILPEYRRVEEVKPADPYAPTR